MRRLLRPALLALTLCARPAPASDFIGPGAGEPLPAAIAAGTARIEATTLREHIVYLADPARDGRGLGTPGLAASAGYVARRLASTGVAPVPQPGGGAAYLHRVPLREVREPGGRLTLFPTASAALIWRAGVDCVSPRIAPQDIAGDVVFAGYGIRELALGHDDFAHLDVRDKVVIFIDGVPPGEAWQSPVMKNRYAAARPQDRYDKRLDVLAGLGARAAIAIEDGLAARLAAGDEPRESYYLPEQAERATTDPPLLRITPGFRRFLKGYDAADRPAPRPGVTATLRVTGRLLPAASENVLGMLAGSDERLRDEAVIIGAHLDHLGRTGGKLHPGADDNASGVAALLEIARAFAASTQRPRRTLIFAFWTGEEAGHFGSEHYVREPLWPLARTTAYVNLDMIAHPWSVTQIRELVMAADPPDATAFLAAASPANFAEPGFSATAPWLGDVLATAGRGTGMLLHLDRTDGRDGGSDYRAFARSDLPWIRFFGNFFPEYHEPGDTPDKLDAAQVERMARLALATVWLIADRDPPRQ